MVQPPTEKHSREHIRLPISVPVFVQRTKSVHPPNVVVEMATALNISASGALIATRKFIPPYNKILLRFPASPGLPEAVLENSVHTVSGVVVRVAAEHGWYLSGISFDHPVTSTPARADA